MMTVEVCYKTQQHSLPLVVVKGDGPSLLGRDWLGKLRLDWSELHQIQSTAPGPLKELLDRHSEVFKDELGTIQGTTAKIQVDPTVQPRFCKARSVPYALWAKVDAELERLDREGIIEKVTYAKWAAPIVPVVKQDGTIIHLWRLQIDGQQSSQDGLLPPPTCGRPVCLIVHWLAGRPCKLDLSHAYLQLLLDDDSKPLLTINTSKGLFQYKCLPFSVASAPAIFQRTIESILKGIPHTSVYLDDILMTGDLVTEHLHNLEEVLKRLNKAGICLKRQKCAFMLIEVEYLGHKLSMEGLRPTESKVQAITDAPAPQNVTQLRSFLGLLSYYSKFLPNPACTAV